MNILARMLKQDAVYWALATIPADENGRPNLIDPVELKCRWEDKKVEFVDATGTQRMSVAKILVGEDLDVGGVIMLGTLADVQDPSFPEHPKDDDRASEIRDVSKIPSRHATKFLRVVLI